MSDGVRVERASDDDLGELIELRFRWRSEEAGETGLSFTEFEPRCRAWLLEHRASHLAYAVRREGRSIGCAWLCLIDRVPGPGKFERRGGMLHSVYVEPSARNAGVGGELVTAMVKDAQEMGLDYVLVHPSARSFEFYRRLGFATADRALELRFDA